MLRQKIANFLANYVKNQEPDKVVECTSGDYLRRWYVIPRNPIMNIYFHEFRESDNDRAYHDHPWANMSWILEGNYIEHIPAEDPYLNPEPRDRKMNRKEGSIVFRKAKSLHQIELGKQCDRVLTLFITGPRLKKWGFVYKGSWIYWKNFIE